MGHAESPDALICTCGYDLRHLPLSRCPECGRPFSPAAHAAVACARWPFLLVCVLTAWIGSSLVEAFSILHYWDVHFIDRNRDWYIAWRVDDVITILTLLAAPIAIKGLWAGRKWGVIATIVLIGITILVVMVGRLLGSADDSRDGEVLLHAGMALYLLWKLHQKSVISRLDLRWPRAPQSTREARRDWVPMMALLLLIGPMNTWTVALMAVLSRSLPVTNWGQAWQHTATQPIASQLNTLHMMVHHAHLWAVLIWGTVGAVWVLIRPRSARGVTTGLLVIYLIPNVLAAIRVVLSAYQRSYPVGIDLVHDLALCVQRLLVPTALVAFAVWCVPRTSHRGAQPGA